MNRALLLAGLLVPSMLAAQEQPAATEKQREPIAFVLFAPDRLAFLIPVNDRWLVRPDIGGGGFRQSTGGHGYELIAGLSVIRRSAPTERGWAYATLRYGVDVEQYAEYANVLTWHLVTATVGGHAQVRDWLGGFGEAGLALGYLNQGGLGDILELEMMSRIGVALRRSQRTLRALPEASGRERVALVLGGHNHVGVLVPLSTHWAVRPDLDGQIWEQGTSTGWNAGVGASLLRRTVPKDDGWLFAALRAGARVYQDDSGPLQWNQLASLTVGAHQRFSERVGGFGEAGLGLDRAIRGAPGSQVYTSFVRPIQRFGITLRRSDAVP